MLQLHAGARPVTHRDPASIGGPPEGLIEHTLPNGAQILVLPTVAAADGRPRGVVALQLWVLNGTAAERPREHGFAHLLEHMVFKPHHPEGRAEPVDLARAIEDLGGDVNAFTSHDETVVHATVPAAAAVAGIEALLPGIVAPQLDPEALQREVEVVVEEIRQYDDDPGARLLQDVMAGLFAGHGYGRPVLGTAPEIRACTPARLGKFHARAYAADRVRFIVVGSVAPKAVIAAARPWLRRLPTARRRPGPRLAVPPAQPSIFVRRDAVLEAHAEFAFCGPALPERDAVALEVASVVLGYGDASRLAEQTRRKAQVVSDAHASVFGSRLGSTFLVTARMRAPQVSDALAAVQAQLGALTQTPVLEEELARAKAVLRSDLVYRRETTQGQAHAIGYTLSLAGTMDADRRYHEALRALDRADVMTACKRWLNPHAGAVGVVLPAAQCTAADARALRGALRRAARPVAKAKGRRATAAPAIRRTSGVAWSQLRCGVRVRAVVDSSVPIVGGWLVWPGGLRLEDARRHGTTPLMAELLTRGCAAIDGDGLAREIDGKAAVLDGFSGRSSAGLHLECLAPDLPAVMTRALQSIVAPRFDAAELDEERRVALADLEAEDDDLGKLAIRNALGRLYRGHPYRLRRRGTATTLARVTAAGLRRQWPAWYPISRMVVGVAGDVDLRALVEQIDDALAPHVRGRKAAPFPSWPGARPKRATAGGGVRHLVRAKEQAHIALTYPGLPIGDPGAPALDVLMAVLGGQAGRLFQRLREDEGLVYQVSAVASEGIDAGDIVFYAATGQAKLGRARAALQSEIEDAVARKLTRGELARAKAWLCGQHEAGLERRGRLASMVAFDEALGLKIGTSLSYRRRIERVSAAAVQRIAAAVLDRRRQVATIVSA